MADIKRPLSAEEQLKQKQAQITSGTAPAQAQRPMAGTGFTNVQKFLQGAGQAGQAIAGKVTGVAKEKEQAAAKAAGEAESIRAGIESAKAKAPSAAELSGKISGVAAGTGTITSGEEADIGYYTSGRYAQEAAKKAEELKQKQATAQGALTELGQTAQAVKSESGLRNLLSNIYRAPSYGGGKQRLDQLLLQGAASQQLGALQQQLATGQAAQEKSLQTTASQAAQALGDIRQSGIAGQQAIQQALSGGISTMSQAAREELAAEEIRQGDLRTEIQNELQNVKYDTEGNPIISRKLNNLIAQATGKGLTEGTEVFNIFSSPTAAFDQLLSQRALAQSDIISAEEKARMDLLSRLSGTGTQFEKAGQTGATQYYTSGIDAASQAARKAFEDWAKSSEATMTGAGADSFTEKTGIGKTGRLKHETTQYATGSVADLLASMGYQYSGGATGGGGGGIQLAPLSEVEGATMVAGIPVPVSGVGDYLDRQLGTGGAIEQILTMPTNFVDELGKKVFNWGANDTSGDWARITRVAQERAAADLKAKLEAAMKSKGYGKKIKFEAPVVEPTGPSGSSVVTPTGQRITGSLRG